MDETSGNIIDSSGNNRTGIGTNLIYNQPGKIGTSLQFNGTTSKIQVTNNPDLGATTNAFTISLWLKTSNPNDRRLLTFGHIIIYQHPTYGSILLKEDSNVNDQEFSYSASISDNAWHHLFYSFDGTNVLAYIDNVSKLTSKTWPHTLGFWSDPIDMMGFATFMSGYLDEFGFWNRALSSVERSILYNSGNGVKYCKKCFLDPTIDGITY